ncbi:hypothetical protein ACS0TY_002737 [Phlomoides rotata]
MWPDSGSSFASEHKKFKNFIGDELFAGNGQEIFLVLQSTWGLKDFTGSWSVAGNLPVTEVGAAKKMD